MVVSSIHGLQPEEILLKKQERHRARTDAGEDCNRVSVVFGLLLVIRVGMLGRRGSGAPRVAVSIQRGLSCRRFEAIDRAIRERRGGGTEMLRVSDWLG